MQDTSKKLPLHRESGVMVKAAPERLAETTPAATEVSAIQDEVNLKQFIMVTLVDDPCLINLSHELSASLFALTNDSQTEGMNDDAFNEIIAGLRNDDRTRALKESLYFTEYLSKWLTNKELLLLNEDGQEEQWQVIGCALPDLIKKKPTVVLKKLNGDTKLATVSLLTVFQGLYLKWRRQYEQEPAAAQELVRFKHTK